MAERSEELAGFRKLYKFSKLLLAGDDPENLLGGLVEASRAIVEADEVVLFRIEGGDPQVRAVATDGPGDSPYGPGDERLEERAVGYSETVVEEVVEREEPMLIRDISEDPRFEDARSIQLLSLTSAIGAPLFDEGKLLGVIYACRKRLAENFTEHHRDLMTVAASQAGLLLSRLASMEALRESESRYRALVETSPSGIAVFEDDTLKFANRRACRLWNRDSVAELVGREISELFDPWRSIPLLEAARSGGSFEAVDAWLTVGGDERDVAVEVAGRPVRIEGEEAIQLVIAEADDGQQQVDRRVENDQLKVASEMAATVGHEINNPLSYVYANLDFVLEELNELWSDDGRESAPDDVREEILDGICSVREGVDRIRSVVESLEKLRHLRDGDCEESSSVTRPLESSLSIARDHLDPEVDVEVDIESIPPVSLGASRLGQVFLNVLNNAAQALSSNEGGTSESSRAELSVRARTEGDAAVVEIEDTGPGIEPEVRSRIFEPFVSTKTEASGNGLGLAISKRIVEAGGGDIEVESTPGDGSLFRLRFPLASSAKPAETRPARGAEAGDHGRAPTGRILIVEPELMLARSLERGLQRHDVETVRTKGEAIEWLESDAEFDVVLCDLELRGGLGRDLFEWLEQHCDRYWNRLVAMSTRHPGPATREYLEELPTPWLAKPFDLEELRRVVRRFLESDVESPRPV